MNFHDYIFAMKSIEMKLLIGGVQKIGRDIQNNDYSSMAKMFWQIGCIFVHGLLSMMHLQR